MPTRQQNPGLSITLGPSDDSKTIRIPGWAVSALTFLVLFAFLGLAVFGGYHYLRAQRLASQLDSQTPDPRTRELQRAILDQQGRVRNLEDDFNALTRQVAEQQGRVETEVERLSNQLRDLDRLAGEVRNLLGLPQPAPTPAPTPRSQRQPTETTLIALRTRYPVLGPHDIAFPSIDPDPTNLGLRLNLLRTQLAVRNAQLRGLQAEIQARRATEQAQAEQARAEAEAARVAGESAAKAQAEAEASVAAAAALAAAKRSASLDPKLAQLDTQVAGMIDRLRAGDFVAPQAPQVLSIPLPQTGPGAPNRWPIKSEITSDFGYRTFRNELNWHNGVDLAADFNTEVSAAQAGVVVFASWQAGYGWCVEIGHGQGYSTLYAHLARILVDTSDSVEVGAIVGLAGSSGNSTGPHLHFEVRLNGKAVDPTPYLP